MPPWGARIPEAAPLHPFTPPALAAAVAALAILLPMPWGPPALLAGTVVVVVAGGLPAAVGRALRVVFPLWILLLVLHGGLGPAPRVAVGGLGLSRSGLLLALGQGARLGAIAVAGFAAAATLRASRVLDAWAARGGTPHLGYLAVATGFAVPRLLARARTITEAQRARGLRLRGSLAGRLRALRALALPLVLGLLAEADDRGLALETRAAAAPGPRTPLAPVPLTARDRWLRLGALALVLAALAWRVAR